MITGRCDKHGANVFRCMSCVAEERDQRIAELEARRDNEHARFLEWRNVETMCPDCSGSGIKAYANTATWRGGIGGQAITPAICDKCWGSGDLNKPWLNSHQQKRIAELEANCDILANVSAEQRMLKLQLEARQRWYHVNDKLPERGELVFVEFKVPTGYTHYALMTSDHFEHTKYGTRWTYAPKAGRG